MIATSFPTAVRPWQIISFASTLYLQPILDLLLADIPEDSQPELRLGLQEALVNAATHGNRLDPAKQICVRYAIIQNHFWWIISDQGKGCKPCPHRKPTLPAPEAESGRGLFILTQIFDQVHWNLAGTELYLCKQVATASATRC